ncbi:hypothetical protein CCC_01565 [Paramagnetospirillum magnetotacticum MS-1]|uniref:Glycosyltransferase RgtA/B/C/D-like domain-containing protein n=1 Tax=Paramagnetospirillum magnetotacticum MS-1 TaxID=272627 RepID=A0A0C2YAE2_PARME|nr:hypothetical protein [Paramagnetospirillum magnetotacticum]KIL96699.1 hypothetical protein CCC_01565 [Paramagnetospirillum magnetotacticum MS-1]
MFVYEALRLNSGLSQHYLDHTGYVMFVLLAWWLKLMHLLGVVDVSSLKALPPTGSAAFEPVYAKLVFAGRYMVAGLSGVFAALFFLGIRAITGNFAVALGAAMVFACSRELGIQALTIYTELPSGLFLFLTFVAVATAGSSRRPAFHLFWAGLCATLALMAKMQGVFVALGMPMVALAFGCRAERRWIEPEWSERLTLSMLLAVPILPVLLMVFSAAFFLGNRGGYQLAIIVYIVAAVWAYGLIYAVPVRERLFAMLAVGGGISAAFLLHLLYHNMGATDALSNFIDHMYNLGSIGQKGGDPGGRPSMPLVVRLVDDGFAATLARRLFHPDPWLKPLDLLGFAVLIAIAVLAWHRRFAAALRVGLLAGMAVGAEAATRIYKIELKHLIYMDTWLIIAAALAAHQFWPEMGRRGRAGLAAVLLVVLAFEVNDVARPNMVQFQRIENACGQAYAYMMPIAEAFRRYCPPDFPFP